MALRVDYQLSAGSGLTGEPIRMSNFEVVFGALGNVSLICNTVTLPNPTIAPVDIHHQNEKLKIAGEVDWAPITIEVRDSIEPDVIKSAWDWFRRAYDPSTGAIGFASDYKEQGTIQQYTSKGALHREWDVVGAWITGLSPGTHDHTSKDPVVASIEFSIDRAFLR